MELYRKCKLKKIVFFSLYIAALYTDQESKVSNLPMDCICDLKFYFDTKKRFNSEIVFFIKNC